MFLRPNSVDEHVHGLLEDMHSILEDVRKHQLQISNAQCATMERLLKVVCQLIKKQSKMVKKQSDTLRELMLGNHTRQLQYEATLTAIAEQQAQMMDALAKMSDDAGFVKLDHG